MLHFKADIFLRASLLCFQLEYAIYILLWLCAKSGNSLRYDYSGAFHCKRTFQRATEPGLSKISRHLRIASTLKKRALSFFVSAGYQFLDYNEVAKIS